MRNTAIKPLIPQDEIKLINETRFIKGETLISRGLFTFKKAKKTGWQNTVSLPVKLCRAPRAEWFLLYGYT